MSVAKERNDLNSLSLLLNKEMGRNTQRKEEFIFFYCFWLEKEKVDDLENVKMSNLDDRARDPDVVKTSNWCSSA